MTLAHSLRSSRSIFELVPLTKEHFFLFYRSEFVREVRLLSVLEDANISRVLGLCSEPGQTLLVAMEYLENGDLNQFLT